MKLRDPIIPEVNLAISIVRDGVKYHHHKSHNIFLDNGREYLSKVISSPSFADINTNRDNQQVVQYVGFGIGGTRQTSADAGAPPLSNSWNGTAPEPRGYGGSNLQTDIVPALSSLERPVRMGKSPDRWLAEVSRVFPDFTSVTYTAAFDVGDINLDGTYTSVPLSEVGLYLSGADPTLPNGVVGTYPTIAEHMIAYDTFNPIPKTGQFSIIVDWTLRF